MSADQESLVILLHGVGSNGANLAPLGEAFERYLPEGVFVCPDAPEPFDGGGFGRQWFSVIGVNDINRTQRVVEARAGFDRVVAREIGRAGFAGRLDRVAFFGFSQGAILSLDAIVDGRWPVAAVVAASGRLASPLGPAPARGTPALLIHGESDEVIPPMETLRAKSVLESAGFAVETQIFPRLGHGVSGDAVAAAGAFLRNKLARAAR